MIYVQGIFSPFDTHTIGVISSEVIQMETMEKNKQQSNLQNNQQKNKNENQKSKTEPNMKNDHQGNIGSQKRIQL